jgi:hypothetical protein
MTTITLVQAAEYAADHIHLMTAQPMGVDLTGLAGGAIQFSCTNALPAVRGATSVDITFEGDMPVLHETIQVSNVGR